ncbi:ABC transporter ATP-binding protein [Zavarzinia sp. CC-PAN008]|uniref:ABC transporter ATP-binding protein n=1 Tax=Zavarzinia sp. CC-PAN008 TaxID=3243332 RepID=UPI003F748FFF
MNATDAAVRFQAVSRRFGAVTALDQVGFEIREGEFFAMLGPSGSGKTTCLRLIAGFDEPDEGTVAIRGRAMTGVPPFRRDVNTVFQDYALFPHMTIADNVGYGLMVKGVPRAQRHKRVAEMLDMVQLGSFGARRPAQLSGGQRQRVALARALINQPAILLLDEPLGALDLKLREEMQVELKAIQHRLGITFVYVTHDQGEALTMSDRVAVFNNGRIEQIGPPTEIYEHPASRFVAGFVGLSNFLADAAGAFAVRPERMRVLAPGEAPQPGEGVLAGRVHERLYLGSGVRTVVLAPDGREVLVLEPPAAAAEGAPRGAEVRLAWPRVFERRFPA